MNVGLPQLERQTASLLSPSLQSVERETSQKRRRGRDSGFQLQLVAAFIRLRGRAATGLTTDRKAGRESCGLPIPHHLRAGSSRCDR